MRPSSAPARASDAFIAKYDRNGLLLWATKAGTTDGLGDGIATDNRGDSYVTGFFFGRSTFGAGEDNETVLTATGSRPDIFVAKYDRNGRLLWATKAGGTDDDVGQGIATDRHGNSYVSGSFLGTAIFGAGEDNETELSGSGGVGQFALFVAKYDRNGLLLWAKGGGSDSVLSGGDTGIATDRRGNSYVTGGFSGTATFGTDEANETVLEAAGDFDLFMAKYGRVPNEQDRCPGSDRSPTVVIDGNDTGVDNVLNNDGCTILDLIRQASDDAANRTEFIRGVALLTRTLLRDGLITAKEAGILRTAASQARFPLS